MRVVLVHGMFCGSRCWTRVECLLSERGIKSQTVSLHPSHVTKSGRDFKSVTASVLSQIQELADQPLVLVGHSLGALVVQKLLPAVPRASILLINPSPEWGCFGPIYPLWVAARRGRFWKGTVQLNQTECRRLLCQGMSDEELKSAHEIVEPESGELISRPSGSSISWEEQPEF